MNWLTYKESRWRNTVTCRNIQLKKKKKNNIPTTNTQTDSLSIYCTVCAHITLSIYIWNEIFNTKQSCFTTYPTVSAFILQSNKNTSVTSCGRLKAPFNTTLYIPQQLEALLVNLSAPYVTCQPYPGPPAAHPLLPAQKTERSLCGEPSWFPSKSSHLKTSSANYLWEFG